MKDVWVKENDVSHVSGYYIGMLCDTRHQEGWFGRNT